MPSDGTDAGITARCYCGQTCLKTACDAQTVAYCHCSDCKRWTGAPAPAFAAFKDTDLHWSGVAAPRHYSVANGVDRWVCAQCGSPMAARFSYLPDQLYVPLGVIDQVDRLEPRLHCHVTGQVPWLRGHDTLPAYTDSARAALQE